MQSRTRSVLWPAWAAQGRTLMPREVRTRRTGMLRIPLSQTWSLCCPFLFPAVGAFWGNGRCVPHGPQAEPTRLKTISLVRCRRPLLPLPLLSRRRNGDGGQERIRSLHRWMTIYFQIPTLLRDICLCDNKNDCYTISYIIIIILAAAAMVIISQHLKQQSSQICIQIMNCVRLRNQSFFAVQDPI